jgi:hypothetical protein
VTPTSFVTEATAPEPTSRMAPLSKFGATFALPIASKVPPELMLLPLSKPPVEMISTPPALTLSDSAVPPERTTTVTPLLTV